MRLLILGAGGHGRVCKAIAEQMILENGEILYTTIEFLDDNATEAIGTLEDINHMKSEYDNVFVALGAPTARKKWTEQAERLGYNNVTLVHKTAYIALDAEIGAGSVIMPHTVIQSGVQLGKGSIISAGAIVDHDSIVEEYCHINAGAVVASMSRVPAETKVDYRVVWK